MKQSTFKTVESIFALATSIIPQNQTCFRGVVNASFELTPSVGRLPPLGSPIAELEREKALLREFKARSALLVKVRPQNDWEWISLAQHYGLPTRLLDWTDNPLVALYFATLHSAEDLYAEKTLSDGAIYALTSHIHIDATYHVGPFKMDETLEFRAPIISDRVMNQSGLFTVHHDPRTAFTTEKLTKFTIPGNLKIAVQEKLSVLGISEELIYPGLDSIAKSIKMKFFKDTWSSLGAMPVPEHATSQIHGL